MNRNDKLKEDDLNWHRKCLKASSEQYWELYAENEKLKEENKAHLNALKYQGSHAIDSIKEVMELKSENEKLKACVEFYADKCWAPRAKDASDWCISSDLEFIKQANGLSYDKGGKLARTTLEDLKTNSCESTEVTK